MPAITVKSAPASVWSRGSSREPRSALSTEGLVRVGSTTIRGRAAALRALADACEEAASMAEDYDRDPEAWEQRERGGAWPH